ncbi:MAG TPA: META domain-containing protein [Candidatus Limnocylindrales bacterium]|nr:META domain-containing protein [Candidatus Limnocylindrales bacterium]
MSANHDLERRIADFYANEAPTRAPDRVLGSILDAIDITPQRRAIFRAPWRFPTLSRRAWLVLAAAALVAGAVMGAIGLGALRSDPVTDLIAPDPATLVWTQDALVQDWPAPVRPEPPSGAVVVPMAVGDDARWDSGERRWEPYEHPDPVGDVAPGGPAWIDIREVHLSAGGAVFTLKLADDPRPIPDPAARWIAYGVVLDTNGDGIADVRMGMDNLPEGGGHRAWRTDLGTGRTHAAAGPPYGSVRTTGEVPESIGLDTYYPDESALASSPDASLWYGLQPGEDTFTFYAWSSVIEAGRVVATDYAPDAGWLVTGSQPETTLVGPTWTLDTEFTRGNESLTLVQTVTFTTAGRVSIDAGCMTGEGAVVVEPDALRVRDIVVTDVPCGSGVAQLSARLMSVLTAGDLRYTLDTGLLELRAGTDVLLFQAQFEGPPS